MKLPAFSPARPRPFLLRRTPDSTAADVASCLSIKGSRKPRPRLVEWVLQPGRRRKPRLLALPLLSLSLLASASGQAIPAMKAPAQKSVFVTFTAAKPDFRHWGDEAVYGFSAGGMLQSHHILGVELRGAILRWGNGLEHQEYALAGPRAAVHLGRISPYVALLGGYAHAWEWHDMPRKYAPKPKLDEGFGPQWGILGGVDYRLNRRISIRAGELGFSRIYATSHSLDQLNASAGIVFHLE